MHVTLLPSAIQHASAGPVQYLTSYIINDYLAVDAGSLGFVGTPAEQARIRHILISHSHADHVGSLPTFLDNVYRLNAECVVVHGSDAVLKCLRRDVFNGRLWADFISMAPGGSPFLELRELRAGSAIELEGVRITPVEVNHPTPTFGFIIEDSAAAIVIPSDTGPTEAIWEQAAKLPNLKAVFLEASFPNGLVDVARAAGHLTPALFAAEIHKLGRAVRTIAVHIKPRFRHEVVAELQALGLPQIEIVRPGHTYDL